MTERDNVWGAWLCFALYFGAAVHDADSVQRAALHRDVPPLIARLRSRDPDVWRPAVPAMFKLLQEIMGQQWQPTGDWARQIDLLMPVGEGLGKDR